MNTEKIIAALSAVEITDGALIYPLSQGVRDNKAYCGVGALLHGAGVSDDQIKALDSNWSLDPVGDVVDRFGPVLVSTYDIPSRELDAALRRCMQAVDDHGVREAEAIANRMALSIPAFG